jgi:hypothetical protein
VRVSACAQDEFAVNIDFDSSSRCDVDAPSVKLTKNLCDFDSSRHLRKNKIVASACFAGAEPKAFFKPDEDFDMFTLLHAKLKNV